MNNTMIQVHIKELLQSENIHNLSTEEILRMFRHEESIRPFIPLLPSVQDPLTGDWVVFNPTRARRPQNSEGIKTESRRETGCPICSGRTTGIVDLQRLSSGYTFINKNLYPAFYPHERTVGSIPSGDYPTNPDSTGFHFLQWTSSEHCLDWTNMPVDDLRIVFERLAALEEKLLSVSDDIFGKQDKTGYRAGCSGYVSIIKNYGRSAGSSLAHDHQQISLCKQIPGSVKDLVDFRAKTGMFFSEFILKNTPGELIIADYGTAVLLVPYFMKRPYDMILVLKDTAKSCIHQLNTDEYIAVARGWKDAITTLHIIMPDIGRETSYNIVTHNGPGAGIYFEFLPCSQERGGFEQLGLFPCQVVPPDAAERIRSVLGRRRETTI